MASMRQKSNNNRAQLTFTVVAFVTILTHFLGLVQPSLAANGNNNGSGSSGGGGGVNIEASGASSQPIWSYQVKPTNYVGAQSAQTGHYTSAPGSLFDAFAGLSQRQGALTSSPFLSILPIILIAAGGLLLLLPMLTMMMASPFGGGGGLFGGGGYQNGFGYPQVGALSKRRSLDQHQQQRGLIELIEHVSTTIEDLSRKYSPVTPQQQQQHQQQATGGSNNGNNQHNVGVQQQQQHQQVHKRAKALNASQAPNSMGSGEVSQVQPPANHKSADEVLPGSTVLSNTVSSGL